MISRNGHILLRLCRSCTLGLSATKLLELRRGEARSFFDVGSVGIVSHVRPRTQTASLHLHGRGTVRHFGSEGVKRTTFKDPAFWWQSTGAS